MATWNQDILHRRVSPCISILLVTILGGDFASHTEPWPWQVGCSPRTQTQPSHSCVALAHEQLLFFPVFFSIPEYRERPSVCHVWDTRENSASARSRGHAETDLNRGPVIWRPVKPFAVALHSVLGVHLLSTLCRFVLLASPPYESIEPDVSRGNSCRRPTVRQTAKGFGRERCETSRPKADAVKITANRWEPRPFKDGRECFSMVRRIPRPSFFPGPWSSWLRLPTAGTQTCLSALPTSPPSRQLDLLVVRTC